MGKGVKKQNKMVDLDWGPNHSGTARNLRKDELAGVIFGCKHHTIGECFSKELFGLPSSHYAYVRKVDPGMPLFLFNYSDRKLYGIFEAASKGQMNIDPRAWMEDGSEYTPYPAQVRIRIRSHCQPLMEDQFAPIISDNYHARKLFWFELDRIQVNKLISLFLSSPVDTNTSWAKKGSNWPMLDCLHATDSRRDGEDSRAPSAAKSWNAGNMENGFGNARGSSFLRHSSNVDPLQKPWSSLFRSSLTSATSEKANSLGEEAEVPFSSDQCNSDDAYQDETTSVHGQELGATDPDWGSEENYRKFPCFDGENILSRSQVSKAASEKKEEFDEHSWESHEESVSMKLESESIKESTKRSTFHFIFSSVDQRCKSNDDQVEGCGGHPCDALPEAATTPASESSSRGLIISKVLGDVEELKLSQGQQIEKVIFLENELVELKRRIHTLEDQCKMLESKLLPTVGFIEESACDPNFKTWPYLDESMMIVGGYDGHSSLSTSCLYSASQDHAMSLCSMSFMRTQASIAKLNSEVYVIGGVCENVWHDAVESYSHEDNRWISRPPLKIQRGGLAGATLNGKIFAIGGGNRCDPFSDVELYDPDYGSWSPTCSMLKKRYATAAAEMNGILYAVGGYDGKQYLVSAERLDPREMSWRSLKDMNTRRACHSLVVLNEKLYALGGFDGSTMVPCVEIFDPRMGLWTMGEPMKECRGYFGAVVIKDSIYVLGGINANKEVLDKVECYKDGLPWLETNLKAIGKRCYFSAIAL